VLIALLVPYLLIGVMGGGIALSRITEGAVPEWVGSLLICSVVVVYVTSGGLRGTAWANTFQTLVFMVLGAVTFFYIVHRLGGLQGALARVGEAAPELLVRGEAIPPAKMFSYTLIPLSVGMFPHIFMHWLTARRAGSFRLSLWMYPLCVAVVWLPSVLLGVIGRVEIPGLQGPAANAILVRMIQLEAPEVLAGLLAAGVFAAVMSSLDSQVLSLGTMFTVAYLLSLVVDRSIFRLGIWSFTGFAALFPVILAAVFWRRSTRAGALASILCVGVLWLGFFLQGQSTPDYTVGGTGIMPVAVILFAGGAVLIVVSLLTRPPAAHTLDKFFPRRGAA